jgi:ubiquinone biosynthesis protein UbiJ
MPSRVFPPLDDWAEQLMERFRPPLWLESEMKQRVLLLINHVLMQEPAAQDRLRRQQGRLIQWRWRDLDYTIRITPAGLLEIATPSGLPDLVLILSETSPMAVVRSVVQGQRPPIRIEGDVQLAGDINWLVDHVRWDPEEDLARVVGDAPAHQVVKLGRRTAEAIKQFVTQRVRPDTASAGAP